jgi:predicted nucleotidyltransferase
MNRLIASSRALEILVSLEQRPEGLGLSELARILQAPTSGVQRALEILVHDGFVEHGGGRRPFVRVESHPAAEEILALARRMLSRERAVELALRASRVPRFAGVDTDGFVYIPRTLADPGDELLLTAALDAIGRHRPALVERIAGPDLSSIDPGLIRIRRMKTLVGSVGPLDPDRRRAGRGTSLGRPHPSLGRIPRSLLRRIASDHRLERVVLFGSAVRSDFEAGSDIDLLVTTSPGTRLDLGRRTDLMDRFDRALGRAVDVVVEDEAKPAVLEEARREGVTLVG